MVSLSFVFGPSSGPSKGPSGMFQPTWVQTKQSLVPLLEVFGFKLGYSLDPEEPVGGGWCPAGASEVQAGSARNCEYLEAELAHNPISKQHTSQRREQIAYKKAGPRGRKVGVPGHVGIWNFP